MKKTTVYSLGILLLFAVSGCGNSSDSSDDISTTKDNVSSAAPLTVQQLTAQETMQTAEAQQQVSEELATLTTEKDYTLSQPLAVWNPYGTVANSLYLSFEMEEGHQLSYTISAPGYEDFSKTAQQTAGAYLLIGFIPSVENTLTLTITDADQAVVTQQSYAVTPPDYPFETLQLQQTQGTTSEELGDGLYALIGAGTGHTFLFDNSGVIRADLLTSGYRADRIVETAGGLILANSNNQIVRLTPLGQLEWFYELSGYELHHDFALVDDATLLVLASKVGAATKEDQILRLDLESGEFSTLVDMTELLSEYVNIANTSDNEDWDWLHLNTIDLINEDEVVVSSRETSAIIKISNVYSDPTLDYLVGEEDIWADTSYSEKVLTQVGEFPNSGGQHSVTYQASDSLAEGQYYQYFYNNNVWWHASNPEYDGSIPEGTGDKEEGDKSMYYKYLVDETAGTYELVQSIDLPYSSIVSNVQQIGDDRLIINSGYNVHLVEEYTTDGTLIASFDYSDLLQETGMELGYRAFKLSFTNFWFTE